MSTELQRSITPGQRVAPDRRSQRNAVTFLDVVVIGGAEIWLLLLVRFALEVLW